MLAFSLAAILLWNNVLAARGDVPVIVSMVAIAFLPLLFERSVRGAVLVAAFLALWLYVLPASIERAGAHRERESAVASQITTETERTLAALTAAKAEMQAECATGIGTRCRGLGLVVERAQEQYDRALERSFADKPAPSGTAVLTQLLGLEHKDLARKILTLLNAFGSELAVAALIHMGVYWRGHTPAVRQQTRPPRPNTAAEFMQQYIATGYVSPDEVYAEYYAQWEDRGARKMSKKRFVSVLATECLKAGLRRRGDVYKR